MKKHNGMRPQDILVLLAMLVVPNSNNKKIAQMLQLSESEVSESIRRSAYAGLLINDDTKKINKLALFEFLKYGIRYVFPVHPTGVGRGIATAHSAVPLKQNIVSDDTYIWEHPEGNLRGFIIEPLYPTLPNIAVNNSQLYELASLIDGIRTGSARVYNLASQELEKRILA